MLRRRAVCLAVAALTVVGGPGVLTRPAEAYPGSSVQLEGAGWGHGRGMGQWGSLGYALNHNWSWTQILDHFYGGTTFGNVGNPTIDVILTAVEGQSTLVTSPGRVTVDGVGTFDAVSVTREGSNKFRVRSGSGCGSVTTDRGVHSGPIDLHPNTAGASNFVQLCLPGINRAYRGFLRVTENGSAQRTLNLVKLNQYLYGVVPRESPASWGDLGGGKGMHALRAQAVAARSYAMAEDRSGPGKTCDTTACQVYGGYWDSTFGVRESANTNKAVDETGDVVRMKNGSPARTEFSSSTGGHTAGGAFTAVVDQGDNVSGNPNHRWTASVPVSSIEAAYPSIGTLRTVDVTRRNGLGAWGGRVQEVVLRGSNGSVTISGNTFRVRFGLKSDWFRVVNNPSGGVGGYYVLDRFGGIFSLGNARFKGSVPGLKAAGVPIGDAPIVSLAATQDGKGYWVLDRAGGIFAFGTATYKGSVPGLRQQGVSIGQSEIIGMAATPSGKGYWVLDAAGGMFAFGDAKFYGSVPGLRQRGVPIGPARIIGMTPTPDGKGYWVLDDQGGMFAFGNARFFGSIPHLRARGVGIGPMTVKDIASSKTGRGYWILDSRGGIFSFGDAKYYGSMPAARIAGTAMAMAPTRTGRGYLIVTAEGGGVHPFGDAPDFGGVLDATGVNASGLDIAVTPDK